MPSRAPFPLWWCWWVLTDATPLQYMARLLFLIPLSKRFSRTWTPLPSYKVLALPPLQASLCSCRCPSPGFMLARDSVHGLWNRIIVTKSTISAPLPLYTSPCVHDLQLWISTILRWCGMCSSYTYQARCAGNHDAWEDRSPLLHLDVKR